ncbi:MAG: formate dehydrogenase accessory sulfurtransferase FdhD [Aquihabitans sp.]
MTSGRTRSLVVHRYRDGVCSRDNDQVIVEAPLEIRLDDHRVTTTMRTPGHDAELAVGFCFADGLLDGASVVGVHTGQPGVPVDGGGNTIVVDTAGRAPVPAPRLSTTTSSCGWCGTEDIDGVLSAIAPVPTALALDPAAMDALAERVIGQQALFDATGGVHAAGLFDAAGDVKLVREDIGRHNAVDKLVGRLLLDGRLPAEGLGLFVSGRTSFEIVQKAAAAGFGAVVAVSAPSSLAIDAARIAKLTLAGFARPGRLNLYVEPNS